MSFVSRRVMFILLVALMPFGAASVYAQPPAPPAETPPPSEQSPPPPDDGPKPAGVGSSQPPPEDAVAPEELELFPATSFPGVPETGTAPSQRPFSGLFSGAEPTGRRRQTLTLSGSVFGGYSTNVAPQVPAGGAPSLYDGKASSLYGGNAALTYNKWWRVASVGAYANGSRTHLEAYSAIDQAWQPRWDVGLSATGTKTLGRRVRLGGSGSVAYSPYLSFSTFDFSSGGVGNLPVSGAGLDYVLARDPNVTTLAVATLSYALNRSSSIEAYYDMRYQTFVASDPLNPDRSDLLAGARYRYRFGRFVGIRAGYGYRRASFDSQSTPAPNVASHYLDVGADAGYGRSYALTRRTTFSFSTDSSLFLDNELSGDPNVENRTRTRLFVGGLADLTQTIGRSWAARVGYRRGVDYDVGFVQPLLSDTGHASIGGLLTSRVDFSATAYYTTGSVGLSGNDNNFTTSSAVAALRFALSRHLAAFAQYFYYHYEYGRGVNLPVYLQPGLDRQGASVGLTALVPLIGPRGRR